MIPRQVCGLGTDQPSPTFDDADFDGILGLGYSSIAEGSCIPPQYGMLANKCIKQQVFCFVLHKESSGLGGSIYWGGCDNSTYTGIMVRIPISRKGYFQVTMAQITPIAGPGQSQANMPRFCPNGCQAIIDTGTSLICGPTKEVLSILKFLGCTAAPSGDYVIPCSKVASMQNMAFRMSKFDFVLTPDEMVIKVSGNKKLQFQS